MSFSNSIGLHNHGINNLTFNVVSQTYQMRNITTICFISLWNKYNIRVKVLMQSVHCLILAPLTCGSISHLQAVYEICNDKWLCYKSAHTLGKCFATDWSPYLYIRWRAYMTLIVSSDLYGFVTKIWFSWMCRNLQLIFFLIDLQPATAY